MAKQTDLWKTISLTPLSGMLDTRSRPAEVPVGGFRWKQSFAVTTEGKLCRRAGFSRFYPNDGDFANGDFHFQNGAREPITLLFESTKNDGTRRLFIGTQSGIWLLNQATGEYMSILSGQGALGTRWHAAELQDVVMFTNNNDPMFAYDLGTSASTPIAAFGVTSASVISSYGGFMLLMNVIQDAKRVSSRIVWSDLNLPTKFTVGTDSIAGFQDLDYGDDILASAPLLGALYVFTRRSIWRLMPSGDPNSVFTFTKVYTEPKNQAGCIAFPNTLVSDGQDLWYMSRDGIYRYNPYIPVPVRDEWAHRADGLIYRAAQYAMDETYCLSPVAEYMPANREIWISWPNNTAQGINNWTLVLQIEQKTADVVDHGFTALVNYRLAPVSAQNCNEQQFLLAASGTDWAIKSIGGVFYRELYPVAMDVDGLPTADIPEATTSYTVGYYSILRGMVPLGLNDRDKKIRKVLVDHDTSEQDVPCVVQLRIGNAYSMVDPNDPDSLNGLIANTHCAPNWRVIKFDGANGVVNPALNCPDQTSLNDMEKRGTRTNIGMCWPMQETARFLFYEFTIQNRDGSPAVGADSCWQRCDFSAMAMPAT